MAKVYSEQLSIVLGKVGRTEPKKGDEPLNTLYEQYSPKFVNSIQTMKAIGGKLDEESGKPVHIYDDWAVVLGGPVVDEKGFGKYAHLLYGVKDEEWKAVRALGLKMDENNDVVIRVRPKSYGHLLEMLTNNWVKRVYELDEREFATTP